MRRYIIATIVFLSINFIIAILCGVYGVPQLVESIIDILVVMCAYTWAEKSQTN
ncbi:hypothetical protein [Pelosinus sp. IPA-1]|uniref:hypothetical protein n=1 Tax=Pelosinus sp. IPA-1 TaxID=3029569 RepID=UPI002436284C|nr:hypothetical protein [Pelosinus sp. IPA-1]GMA99893.1 hypothetical protein PIPA1_26930 [Pelosinus sp. IPA-1]